MTYPDTARIYEDRGSELRELRLDDIRFDQSGEGNPFAIEEERTTGPIVILGAWS